MKEKILYYLSKCVEFMKSYINKIEEWILNKSKILVEERNRYLNNEFRIIVIEYLKRYIMYIWLFIIILILLKSLILNKDILNMIIIIIVSGIIIMFNLKINLEKSNDIYYLDIMILYLLIMTLILIGFLLDDFIQYLYMMILWITKLK